MINVIENYSLDTVVIILLAAGFFIWGLYKGGCFLSDRYGWSKRVHEDKEKDDLIFEALTNLHRAQIVQEHRRVQEQGHVEETTLDHLEKLYTTYVALGGNGFIKKMMEEVRKLPIG